MKDYRRYYEAYSAAGGFLMLRDALLTRSKTRRLSLFNRQRDYALLAKRPDLLALHREMDRQLADAAREWPSHDYGEGYFYQSLDLVGVTGLRDTRGRVEAMALADLVRGRSVLEIGCNTGFVALSVADAARSVLGFDNNPFLIAVAAAAAAHLGIANVTFSVSSFEEFSAAEPFEVVLSFANHSTYDGNTKHSVVEYFTRCRDLLRPGGLLLFESHTPAYEGDGLAGVLATLRELFSVESERVLDYGGFLDRGRTFVVARRAESA
jgi:SAM-dependent methyltransferase